MKTQSSDARPLKLCAGEAVEVLTEREILSTLDEQGAIDGLPFMPEMLEYCGKRFRVYKRADKTCDTITVTGSRRLYDTVHLEGLRCTGQAHGGCQALCLLFWKEAWLKRVKDPDVASQAVAPTALSLAVLRCDRARLDDLTQRRDHSNGLDVCYRCQATDLLRASEPLAWWDVRQYLRDIRAGNVGFMDVVGALALNLFLRTLKIGAYRAQIWAYNKLQSWRGGAPFPYFSGTLEKTPSETLNLQPGELVRVKSYKEILETLNTRSRNRGLRFDAEMVPYCGSTRRVLARVERIVDERTGELTTFSTDCLILDGAVCRATYSDRRFFCPRSIYPYWREIWLKRVPETADSPADLGATIPPMTQSVP